jgi:hypothetical protein
VSIQAAKPTQKKEEETERKRKGGKAPAQANVSLSIRGWQPRARIRTRRARVAYRVPSALRSAISRRGFGLSSVAWKFGGTP